MGQGLRPPTVRGGKKQGNFREIGGLGVVQGEEMLPVGVIYNTLDGVAQRKALKKTHNQPSPVEWRKAGERGGKRSRARRPWSI